MPCTCANHPSRCAEVGKVAVEAGHEQFGEGSGQEGGADKGEV